MRQISRIKPLFLIFIAAVFTSFILSCATSQTGMYGEDEASIAGTAADDSSSTGGDEDDVLRLLGINDSEAAQAPSSVVKEPVTAPKVDNTGALQAEIDRLEGKVTAKDRELRSLREQLDLKESLIKSKEQNLEQARSGARTSAYTESSFRSRYDEALRLYYNRRYREAIDAFDQLISQGGDNSLVDNCQYWKGECYYALSNYEQAILEFQKVFTYSDSNKLDDAQLKLGLCYMKLGNSERGRREFQKLLDEYPNSEYAGRARSYLN
jgi:tol-pal system protein YbgF